MSETEERLAALEKRVSALERVTAPMVPLGPSFPYDDDWRCKTEKALIDAAVEAMKKADEQDQPTKDRE